MIRKKKTCKKCNSSNYIFGKGLCINCYKSQLKSIKKVSQNHKVKTLKYSELRDDYLDQHKVCECCGVKPSIEIHHKAGRDGNNLFQHFLAVCRTCHNFIENNPTWAKENGFSISRLN